MSKRKGMTLEQAATPLAPKSAPMPRNTSRKRQQPTRRAATQPELPLADALPILPALPIAPIVPVAPIAPIAPAVADRALRLPDIAAFPGLTLSTAAAPAQPTPHPAPATPAKPAKPAMPAMPATPATPVVPNAHEAPLPQGIPNARQCLAELRAALAEGWEVVPPIFARPLWAVADDSITAFNFVLRRGRATRLLLVPDGRTVQRFIRERHLAVDYRR